MEGPAGSWAGHGCLRLHAHPRVWGRFVPPWLPPPHLVPCHAVPPQCPSAAVPAPREHPEGRTPPIPPQTLSRPPRGGGTEGEIRLGKLRQGRRLGAGQPRQRALCLPSLPAAPHPSPHTPQSGINPSVPVCRQVPQRTSPTGPKSTSNPARLSNVPSSILRKNSPAARNGGTEADAQILELNQQVGQGRDGAEHPLPWGRPPPQLLASG